MKLLNEFDVAAPVDQTWPLLTDLHTVASCMPGAQLENVEGEAFSGAMKLRVGALNLQFRGSGEIVHRDDENHRLVLDAKGKDKKGTGTARAAVAVVLSGLDGDRTHVQVETDLNVSGRLAQLGHGAIRDVGDQLAEQFATTLAERLAPPAEEAEGPEPEAAVRERSDPEPTGRSGQTPAAPPAAAVIDLGSVLGESRIRIVIAVAAFLVGVLVGRCGRR